MTVRPFKIFVLEEAESCSLSKKICLGFSSFCTIKNTRKNNNTRAEIPCFAFNCRSLKGWLTVAMLNDDNNFTGSDRRIPPIHLMCDPKMCWKPSEGWQMKNASPL